ncbi:MAG: S9 family peptidase [Bryobacterales bacterium]|nr:S9 family peptidase [Bryobacterales bacterium]
MVKPRLQALRILSLVLTVAAVLAQSSKRPLTHRDYDAWRSIGNQRLSPDGKHLAYALFPQDGDGEVVLRDLETGQERRFLAGARPTAPSSSSEGEPSEPGPAPSARGISLAFTSNGSHLVFTTFPSKSGLAEARKAKKKPEEMPKGELVIVGLSGGDPVKLPAVRSFSTPKESGRWLAYVKESAAPEQTAAEAAKDDGDQRASRGATSRPGSTARYGAEMTLRDLNDGAERKFADVVSFEFSKDGELLLYTVSSRKAEANGIYAVNTATNASNTLASGKGKYQGLQWDEPQQRAVFHTDRDTANDKQPKFAIYLWKRGAEKAEALVATGGPGMRPNWNVSERGSLQFSKDGSRLFFSTAPARPVRDNTGAAATEAAETVTADLWHWRDENVQSMQKVRADQERSRSYRAVYQFASNATTQLADATMSDLSLFDDAKLAIGTDDREYRPMVEFGERFNDTYLVDTASGSRKLLFRKTRGTYTPSPDGRYLASFNGKDWTSYEAATGKTTNLTESLGVAFFNEEQDTPGYRSPYGFALWTKDSSAILVNDRYDVWLLHADGSRSRAVTDGIGRREQVEFRILRFDDEERTPGERPTADPAKPLLLAAQNLRTRESGFWRDRLDKDGPPEKLLMAAKRFSNPTKAKNRDTVLLTAERFDEFPDLHVTDSTFASVKKASHANPQKDSLLWGSAELLSFRSTDGAPLQAALYKPENFDPKKKYPMIVYIYERLSQTVHSFRNPQPGTSVNIPYYVSNGYLVLTPDIAYTIGYPGQSALKCVLPAIQAVADRGFVDENAIGIQGHSWGGYQISYMITQTTRFKAAAAGAPVANMISAYDGIRWGTGLPRQFQYEKSQSRIGGTIWQYPMRFIENSPIFSADRVRTPLLMLHNDNDDAVPWYQGIEYFLALRRLGKEVYLFNYNGEPHGLRRRPNQKDWTVRMQQYFDHHLKGSPKPEWMERGIPYVEREQEKEKMKRFFEEKPSGDRQP